MGGPMQARVLVVDDEPLVRDTVAGVLELDGADAEGVGTGEQALCALESNGYDLVILDVGLPGMSGFDTMREIRTGSDVPVIFLTAAGELSERVAGFDLGADDYVVKPTELPELSRRVRAVLRRRSGQVGVLDELTGPCGIRMRLRSHEICVNGEALNLTPKEFSVMRLLLERRGQVINTDELSSEVWGYETFGSRNFVEAHISRLRSKLRSSGAGDVITTLRGVGYVIR